jgi:parallel beta-helix repeat protein
VYLSTGAHHNRFQRLVVKNNAGSGFTLSSNGGSADYNEILNCVIHDNGRLDEGNTGYGIYLTTSYNTIAGNDIYRNNGYGIHQLAPAGNGNNNVIWANRIHDNAVHGVIGVGGSSSYAVVLANGDNNLIANNLIYANQGGVLIYNNTTNARVYNNTITGNRDNGIDLQYYGSAPFIRNNIVYNNGGTIVNYGGTGTPVLERNLLSDPAFVDESFRDFRLNWFSVAKDQGLALSAVATDYAGVQRPQAGAFDIGAFEYVDPATVSQPAPAPAPQPAPTPAPQPAPGTTTTTDPAPAPTQPSDTTTEPAPAPAPTDPEPAPVRPGRWGRPKKHSAYITANPD